MQTTEAERLLGWKDFANNETLFNWSFAVVDVKE